MRLRLFDRIRRLVHPRRSQATGTVPQGRHRRDQRHAPGYGPSAVPAEPSLAGPVIRPADIAPDEWPAPESSFVPSAQPGPAHRATGSPAVQVGGARARIREAPGEPDARSAPSRPPDRYQTRPPADRAAPPRRPGRHGRCAERGARSRRGRHPAPGPRGRAAVPARPRGRLAAEPAVRGAPRPGPAADRGRPQELRLARAHRVAAVGSGHAPAARGHRGGRPAGRVARADQGTAGGRARRDLHRAGRRPRTRRDDRPARRPAPVGPGLVGCVRGRLRRAQDRGRLAARRSCSAASEFPARLRQRATQMVGPGERMQSSRLVQEPQTLIGLLHRLGQDQEQDIGTAPDLVALRRGQACRQRPAPRSRRCPEPKKWPSPPGPRGGSPPGC